MKPKQFQDISARGTKPRGRFDTEHNAKTPVKSKQIREKPGKSVHGVFSNRKLYVSTGAATPRPTVPLTVTPQRGIARRQSLHRLTDFAAGNLRCSGEDRPLVGFEDGQARREILRVIRARLVSDAQVGTEECGSKFGDLS